MLSRAARGAYQVLNVDIAQCRGMIKRPTKKQRQVRKDWKASSACTVVLGEVLAFCAEAFVFGYFGLTSPRPSFIDEARHQQAKSTIAT